MPLDYTVIASGSSGNAVRIGRIMIDCGIPFKKMEKELYKCHTLLITHSHSDHIKPSTLEKIYEQFPKIKVYANADVAYQYHVNTVLGTNKVKLAKDEYVVPFDCVHDVPCTGFVLLLGDITAIYATDTSLIIAPEGYKYDYLFLESNYDERKLKERAKQYTRKGYDPIASSLRHLSTQRCKEFYFVNRKSADSELIELHKSWRFY